MEKYNEDPIIITEENRKLYIYIGQLHRALGNAMDAVGNLDNGENCPYCGDEYDFDDPQFGYNCVNVNCDGNEAQKILDEVNQVCRREIIAVGQGTLNIK